MFSFLSDLLRWFGQGLLTRPSSSTDGLSVPGRWRVTWRPRSAEGRLFVDHYLGGSLGSAVEAARRAGYPWTEQMSRKMSRNVEKRGVHAAPALREEALPRPRAQRMCRGVHTESSADRSEMGQIDRSRRRRGCAGALRHKICTASLDNRPLIHGFFFRQIPHSFVLSSNVSTTNARAIWLRFGAFLSPSAPWLRIH